MFLNQITLMSVQEMNKIILDKNCPEKKFIVGIYPLSFCMRLYAVPIHKDISSSEEVFSEEDFFTLLNELKNDETIVLFYTNDWVRKRLNVYLEKKHRDTDEIAFGVGAMI